MLRMGNTLEARTMPGGRQVGREDRVIILGASWGATVEIRVSTPLVFFPKIVKKNDLIEPENG